VSGAADGDWFLVKSMIADELQRTSSVIVRGSPTSDHRSTKKFIARKNRCRYFAHDSYMAPLLRD